MDICKVKWTKLEQEIFSLLCLKAGEKLSQREIAQALKVSPTAVANSLTKLQEDNLITREKTKTINFISLNRENAGEMKRVENLKSIYLSGLSTYLHHALAGGTITVFGSYAKGEDSKDSDIDIAVIGRKDKMLELDKFERILHRPINVSFYPSWTAIHKHLRNNILNGIVLHGSVEL